MTTPLPPKPKVTWETTNAAASAIMDAEKAIRDAKTARLKEARESAEKDL